MSLITTWSQFGGTILYGTAPQTSCVLMLREGQKDSIWPLTIYPTGYIEVVFQYLSTRPPFDNVELRDEYRRRLNDIGGVEIPRARLALRPSIRVAHLTNEAAQSQLAQTLSWFIDAARHPGRADAGSQAAPVGAGA